MYRHTLKPENIFTPCVMYRCCTLQEQETVGCRSAQARSMLTRRCLTSPRQLGLFAWLKMLMLCMLCFLGQWVCHASICR